MVLNFIAPICGAAGEAELRRSPLYFRVRRRYHRIRSLFAPRPLPDAFAAHGAIFVHIPKTAGNSMSQSLFGAASVDLGAHTRAVDWRRWQPQLFASCFKFAFTRHPVDRFVSAFAFLQQGGMTAADHEWSQAFLHDCPDIGVFVGRLRDRTYRNEVLSYPHFAAQWRFVCDAKQRVIVDFIGCYERITEDFETVRRRLGLGEPLPSLNVTDRDAKSRQTLSLSEIEYVARLYRQDMQLFGYST